MVRESAPVIELDEKVGMIILLTQGKLIVPRPETMAPLSSWRIEAEILYNEIPVYVFFVIIGVVCGGLAIVRKLGILGWKRP